MKGDPTRELVALRPDGKMVATVDNKEAHGKVVLWDIPSGKQVATLDLERDRPKALAFSPDCKLLAVVGIYDLTVWDVTARKPLVTIKERLHSAYILEFSADGKKLGAVDRFPSQVRVWDVTSGKVLSSFRLRIETGPEWAVFSRDLGTLALANAQEIDLWDVNTRRQRAILSEHRGRVNSVQFSRDGKTLVASSILRRRRSKVVGDIRLWDVATGKERKVFQEGIGHIWSVRLSPDGKTVSAFEGEGLKLLDVATGKQQIVSHAPGHYFSSHSFTTDGRLFVISRTDGTDGHDIETIKLWEVSLPKSKGK
jgi:WD40 repeat protein